MLGLNKRMLTETSHVMCFDEDWPPHVGVLLTTYAGLNHHHQFKSTKVGGEGSKVTELESDSRTEATLLPT